MSFRIHCERCDKSIPAVSPNTLPPHAQHPDQAMWFHIPEINGPGAPEDFPSRWIREERMSGVHFCSLACASEWFAKEAGRLRERATA